MIFYTENGLYFRFGAVLDIDTYYKLKILSQPNIIYALSYRVGQNLTWNKFLYNLNIYFRPCTPNEKIDALEGDWRSREIIYFA